LPFVDLGLSLPLLQLFSVCLQPLLLDGILAIGSPNPWRPAVGFGQVEAVLGLDGSGF
jgi:hypothetical protein